jgi:hypothetical protein
MTHSSPITKKQRILEVARELGSERFTPFEVEQIRRQLVARFGVEGKTAPEYIAEVLKDAGLRVLWSTQEDIDEHREEELADLLHFSTLEEAEMCLVRLDELWRKYLAAGNRPARERVLEIARLGRRRAEMISRNKKVDPHKRAEKAEIAQWFKIWLETPEAFFDWLELRKQAQDFQDRFGETGGESG